MLLVILFQKFLNIFQSTWLIKNNLDDIIESATAAKNREKTRQLYQQRNKELLVLRYSNGLLLD